MAPDMPGDLNVTAPHARTLSLPLHGRLGVSLLYPTAPCISVK